MTSTSLRVALASMLVVTPMVALSAQTQDAAPRENRVGVVAGLNSARLTGGDGVTSRSQNGLMAGVYALRPVADNFDFQSELLFTQKGVAFSQIGASGSITINYIEIPLLVRVIVPVSSSDIRPHLYAGPAFALRLSCNESVTSGSFSASGSCSTNAGTGPSNSASEPKSYDIGGVLGGGVAFNMSGGRAVSVGARYEFGLVNLDQSGSTSSPAIRNRVLTLLASIDFAMPGTH